MPSTVDVTIVTSSVDGGSPFPCAETYNAAPMAADVQKLLCPGHATLLEALRRIDSGARGVTFVVDSEARFLGLLTDGDVRRALLARCPFETPARELVDKLSTSFRSVKVITDPEVAQQISEPYVTAHVTTPIDELRALVNDRIRIIPLLDDEARVVDVFEPQVSFYAPIASSQLQGNELSYVMECIESSWISSQGRFVAEFERVMAEFCGTTFAVATANGTAALHLALIALGIGPGDEVIVPDLTFAATANAVLHAGARPVLVDVEATSWCLDPSCAEAAITDRTKALIPVHLYGQPASLEPLRQMAARHGLAVVEDAAEAIGATLNGRRVGGFGDIGCFSFFGNKIVTTGEGGLCVTRDPVLADRMRKLRDHGMSTTRKYWHDEVGYNYRMTNLQAAVGVAQMERIDEMLTTRERIRSTYAVLLSGIKGLISQPQLSDRKAVLWLASYLLPEGVNRDRLIELASERGVDVRPFFYRLSQMPPYRGCEAGANPVSRELSRRGINLPTSLSFNDSVYEQVADVLRDIMQSGAAA